MALIRLGSASRRVYDTLGPPVRAMVVVAAFALCACSSRSPSSPPPAARPRLVSLAPSLTEIVYAIGCGRELVADTRFDDYPPQARALPHVADLTHVDLEELARLSPTGLLALHDEEREGGEAARALGVRVSYLPNRGLSDLYADIEGVGAACGSPAQASRLAQGIRERLATVRARAAHAGHGKQPRVLFLLGLPGFTAGKGSYIDDVIEAAGGVNVAGTIDQAYPDLSDESIAASDPDVIVIGRDVPFGADVRSREPWRSLRAVRDGRIVMPPDDDIIERPGPRIVQGVAWLASAIR